MQLTLYVGSLSEFFHAPLARAAAENGERPPDLEEVRSRVDSWRAWVSEGLREGGHLRQPLDWEERTTEPAVRQPIAVDSLRALKLWLAYDGGVEAPSELPDRPERDPRWMELAAADFASTDWDQILVPELWLPGDAAFTFPCPYPDGHEVQAGWSAALLDQLVDLHERKFGATPLDALRAARSEPAGDLGLAALARQAAGTLRTVAVQAKDRALPMLLSLA